MHEIPIIDLKNYARNAIQHDWSSRHVVRVVVTNRLRALRWLTNENQWARNW